MFCLTRFRLKNLLNLHGDLLKGLRSLGIDELKEWQSRSFHSLMKGRDLALIAETGGGKTVAYLLPLLQQVYSRHEERERLRLEMSRENPFRCRRPWVVLCANVDLCAQVCKTIEKLDSKQLIQCQTTTRLPNRNQNLLFSERVKFGVVDVVVSTLRKFVDDLKRFGDEDLRPECVVFDDCDELFQHLNPIFDCFEKLRPRPGRGVKFVPTQLAFATATWISVGDYSVASLVTRRCCSIDYVESDLAHRIHSEQKFLPGSEDWQTRVGQLIKLLDPTKKTLIFVNSRWNCYVLHETLKKNFPCIRYSKGPFGKLFPRARDLKKFLTSDHIMIATDAASRGLDLQVDLVINFEFPRDCVGYVQRLGRGREEAVSFVSKKDETLASLIQQLQKDGKSLASLFSRKRSLRRRIGSGFLLVPENSEFQNDNSDEKVGFFEDANDLALIREKQFELRKKKLETCLDDSLVTQHESPAEIRNRFLSDQKT